MKPLPTTQVTDPRPAGTPIPSLPGQLTPPAGDFSTANRRSGTCAAPWIYPWLLFASTATTALFCYLYITKPVITPSILSLPNPGNPPAATETEAPPAPKPTSPRLMPGSDSLPGEVTISPAIDIPVPSDPRSALPSPPSSGVFEETNLRIQHILTAEAPGGHLDRLDIEVPVLYHSRSLRWTAAEVSGARELLTRLMDHQYKSRQLRDEGADLLTAWNRLISNSIPATELRADSPSLPDNQRDGADSPRPAGMATTESIQIKTSGK